MAALLTIDRSLTRVVTLSSGVVVFLFSTVANPNEVLLAGLLDGGAGCLFQTSLTGLMAVNATNARRASRSIEIPNNERTSEQHTHTQQHSGEESSEPADSGADHASCSVAHIAVFAPVCSASQCDHLRCGAEPVRRCLRVECLPLAV